MKKYLLMTAMIVAMAGSGVAWSQNAPPANGGQMNGGPMGGGQMNGGQMNGGPGGMPPEGMDDGAHFQEHKEMLLKHMKEHLAETQQRITCVQDAANPQALRACMPQMHGGMQRGEMPHGDMH